jgi:SNF2 family DNA or RNA helicase
LLIAPSRELDLRWTTEARRFVQNRQQANSAYLCLHGELARIRQGGRHVADDYLADLRGLELLDDHQRVNVAAMTLPDSYGLCLFDEQGAGKTVSLIFAFDALVSRDEIDLALIVAPKSMVPEWPRDFARFKRDLYRVQVVTGGRAQKREALRSGADVLVTNFETAVSMEQE